VELSRRIKTQPATVVHPWPPVFSEHSRVLILGTLPSPTSRAQGFYYGHPHNIFWPALATVLGVPEPKQDPGSRKAFVLAHDLALWDVLQQADITGASDASIANPVANRMRPLIEATCVKAVFTVGKTADKLYRELCVEEAGIESVYLPSTSPANRAQHATEEFRRRWLLVRDALAQGEAAHDALARDALVRGEVSP
jgi:hypoxanthine-DNA glycosylase